MKKSSREVVFHEIYSSQSLPSSERGGVGWESFRRAIPRLGSLLAWFLLTTAFPCQAATSYTYDPALGTLPQQQGWSEFGITAGYASVSGGILNLDTTSDRPPPNNDYHGWTMNVQPFVFGDGVVTIEATLRVNASNHYNDGTLQRAGYYLAISDGNSSPVWTSIAADGVWFLFEEENNSEFVPLNLADGQFHDFKFVANPAGLHLYLDDAKVLETALRTDSTGSTNALWFGDLSVAGISNTDMKFYRATFSAVPVPGAVWLFLSGLSALLVRTRKFCKAGRGL